MANFLFYKYHFEKTEDRTLFLAEDGEVLSEELLGRKLDEDLSLKADRHTDLNLYDFKTDRKGEQTSESYVNEIRRYDSGIALLQVRNNKHKKFMPVDQTEQQEVGHYPICWVIVDTRLDSMAILVQQKNDTFKNSDAVAALLVDYCQREFKLSELGWRMVTQKRLCVGSIWDIVKMRTANGQDRVKSLCIKISGKKANEDNEVDKALQMILEKLAAPEGELKLTSDDNAKKILDDTREDVRNTVDMLIENKYSMKIGFDKSGSVEYGKEAPAIYGIADNVVTEFEEGSIVMREDGTEGYNLDAWLDTLMPEDGAHTYIEAEKKKRKNGRRSKK
jgi:hypothetical protein